MNDGMTADGSLLAILDRDGTPQRPAKTSWPLMCDVHGCRAGVPEHLIQWRRAAGEDDPDPQL